MAISLVRTKIVKIGDCVSGTLSSPRDPVKRRIALATESAWQKLDQPELYDSFQQDLRRKFFNSDTISERTFQNFGFLSHVFENGKGLESYGILQPTAVELKSFAEAYELFKSVGPGQHRLGYLGLLGVSGDNEITELPDNLYCALLGKMAAFDAPDYPTIISVGINDQSMKDFQQLYPGGTKRVVFSRSGLESYNNWGIPTLPKTKLPPVTR